MEHDYRSLESLCQEMASDCVLPESAEALTRLSLNYRQAAQVEPLRASMRRTALVGLVVFAVYLPVAAWLHHGFVRQAQPTGRLVEQLLRFEPVAGSAFRAPTYAFGHQQQPAELVIYEDLRALGPATTSVNDVEKIGAGRYLAIPNPPAGVFSIVLSASDNSDPRTNGRRYWLVSP